MINLNEALSNCCFLKNQQVFVVCISINYYWLVFIWIKNKDFVEKFNTSLFNSILWLTFVIDRYDILFSMCKVYTCFCRLRVKSFFLSCLRSLFLTAFTTLSLQDFLSNGLFENYLKILCDRQSNKLFANNIVLHKKIYSI